MECSVRSVSPLLGRTHIGDEVAKKNAPGPWFSEIMFDLARGDGLPYYGYPVINLQRGHVEAEVGSDFDCIDICGFSRPQGTWSKP